MKTKSYLWLTGFFVIVAVILSFVGFKVVQVDPFFHYHKPDMEVYFYSLDNQRSQNDGIIRFFDYDAIITGTSMTENFRSSSVDTIFGVHSIKIPFSGGTYKEINDNLKKALSVNPDIRMIIRGLDMDKFADDKDAMREDLGEFPTYLYDENIFNDVEYVFNRNVIFDRVCQMVEESRKEDAKTGITSFDAYSNWMDAFTFGIRSIRPNGVKTRNAGAPVHLTDEERETVLRNIHQNVTELAREYPNVDFYYFFTPYSILWWQKHLDSGTVYKQIEAEQLVIEEILKCRNIKLFSFNGLTDLTTDINNYKDLTHYGIWINELILKMMKDQKCLLTTDNYKDYIDQELAFMTSFDFWELNAQEDYENDLYASALLNEQYYGVTPINILESKDLELNHAQILEDQYDGRAGILCTGALQREADNSSLAGYLKKKDYIGAKFTVEDISKYRFISFYGKKVSGAGQPTVYVYDGERKTKKKLIYDAKKIDENWHQYMIYVADLQGPATIVFNGGAIDRSGGENSQYLFSKVMLY